jgi:hypothetical protein
MPAYHLQKEGCEYQVNDTATLVQLACLGLVLGTDRLRRVGEKRFRAAETFKELKSALKTDTWEAWEILGDTDPAVLWKTSVRWIGGKQTDDVTSSPGLTDKASLEAPVETPAKVIESKIAPVVEKPPKKELEPLPKEPDDSNVIVFPTPKPTPLRRVQSSAQPAPFVDIAHHPAIIEAEQRMRSARPPKQFRAFPWVFGGVAIVGGILLWGVTFYVQNTATWTSERPGGPPPEQVIADAADFEPDQPVQVVADEPSEADALFLKKTEEMRARMSRGVVEMQGRPDDLTNALMIEMSRMRVGLVKVKAPVHAWGGRNNDLPEAAEVHIVLKDQNDLITQLGAVVLVVGKYLQAYELELTDFIVGLEDESGIVQEQNLPPKGVRAVYMNRKTMRELLLTE